MFKNIFSRLLFTHLLMVISVLIIMSFVVSALYSNYLFFEKERSLKAAAYKVESLTENYLDSKLTKQELNTALNSIGLLTESMIYVIRATKQELVNNNLKLEDSLNEPFIYNVLVNVLNDEYVFKKRQYSDNLETTVIFTGYPLKVNNQIEGAVLIFSPVNSIENIIHKMNIYIWLAALVLLLISSLLIYLNSLRITRPLKSLDAAARRLAMGQNTERIKISSKDEIGRLINTFNDMKDKLEATEKMRREFIANVSHDLRSPLTSINGFVQGMIDGIVKPDDYTEYLKIIKDETERLIMLTGDVLELAKIQSGTITLDKKYINLFELCSGAISSQQNLLIDKGIEVKMHFEHDLIIYGDRNRLKQILINLLNNAIKYSIDKGVIYIDANKQGDSLQLKVCDDGLGINPEDLPYIFEKFYRADKVRNAKRGGTGLGLSIVKELVELHDGEVCVESKPNCGTAIIIKLPLN